VQFQSLPRRRFSASLAAVAPTVSLEAAVEESIICGSDGRKSFAAGNAQQQEWSTAVGVLALRTDVAFQGRSCPNPDTGTSFDCTTVLKTYDSDLCPGERFSAAPQVNGACAAFLVKPDIMVTAGHCLYPDGTQTSAQRKLVECKNRSVIMRWRESDNQGLPNGNLNVLERHIYSCASVLAHGDPARQNPGSPADWVVFKLDRAVSGGAGTGGPITPAQEPLIVSKSNPSVSMTGLTSIGFPYGTTLKVDPGVRITTLNPPVRGVGTFLFEGDIAPGNSGGPVLNSTGEILGLVSAAPPLVAVANPKKVGTKCMRECYPSARDGEPVCNSGLFGDPHPVAVSVAQFRNRIKRPTIEYPEGKSGHGSNACWRDIVSRAGLCARFAQNPRDLVLMPEFDARTGPLAA